MAAPAKIRRAGMLSATLLCAAATSVLALPASAQTSPPSPVVIDQVQLGDVNSTQTLHVTATPSGVSQGSTTVGNSAVVAGDNTATDYQGNQHLSGDSHATATVNVDNSAGAILAVSSSATGNTATAGTGGAALTGSSTQLVDGFHTVTAETHVNVGGPDPTGQVSADAAAIGNTQGWETNNGSIVASTSQTQFGETYATVTANVANTTGEGGYSATAVGNNVTSDATNSPVDLTVGQQAAGFRTRADLTVNQGSGGDVIAVATTSANNINVTSDSFAASLTSDQDNEKAAQAEVTLNVGTWSGTATASSYAIGNSAIVSNAGSYTTASGVQDNSGDVSAISNFNGGSGADSQTLATAVGNAYSAYACPDCNGAVNANIRQTNSGGVSATGTTTVNSGGFVTGVASAVGNTATVQVRKN